MNRDQAFHHLVTASRRIADRWSGLRDAASDASWEDFSFAKGNGRWASGVARSVSTMDVGKCTDAIDVCDAVESLVRSRAWDGDYDEPSAVRDELLRAIGEVRGQCPARPVIGPEPLLQAVYDAPHEDSLRRAYGDLLIQRGDPLGTFISLQLQQTESSLDEARSLLIDHRAAWRRRLGRVGRVVSAIGMIYRRGFPAEGCIDATGDDDVAVGDPAWATFERLEIRRKIDPELLLHPVMRSLVEVSLVLDDSEALSAAYALMDDERSARWRKLTVRVPEGQTEFFRKSPALAWRLKSQEPPRQAREARRMVVPPVCPFCGGPCGSQFEIASVDSRETGFPVYVGRCKVLEEKE